jgi:3-methyladenine DNA glycosylase AlkD
LHSLVAELTDCFKQKANPSKAKEMERYMKNLFPFFGIQAPTRRIIHKTWLKQASEKLTSRSQRWELVHVLWLQNEREFHHTCMDWIQTWQKNEWSHEDAEKLTWLLTNHSWWDSVDIIATHFVGKFVQLFPKEGAALIASYRSSSNIWLNRTSILFQLKYKKETDIKLLYEICAQMEPNKAFFIQKAIGWSLRELGKTYPTEVLEMVDTLKLSGLARREALRRLV